ncbi:hypothetical protein Plhal304r1_c003g0012141 [Plasmopara halstedii]
MRSICSVFFSIVLTSKVNFCHLRGKVVIQGRFLHLISKKEYFFFPRTYNLCHIAFSWFDIL